MKKLRLAIVRQQYRLDGGAERFISCLLEALNGTQIDFHIIARSWKNKSSNSTYNFHICNPKKFNRISRERGFAHAAKKYWEQEKFDIVQSHERITGCDIFRAGDGVHRAWLEKYSRIASIWKRINIKLSPYHQHVLQEEKKIFNTPSLKAVICNSEMVKQEIMQYFPFAVNKIHVIYNPINLQKFRPAIESTRNNLRQILNLPLNATVMIYVGSGFKRKGLKTAIAAIASTDRYLIVVGQDKQLTRYQKLANELNCLNRLRFVGLQYKVQPFYHAADALLLPTLYDPFPNTVLEAMACGLAVITSSSCGGAEFINIGKEGFICDALDTKGLSEAILATPALSENSIMGNAARLKISHLTPQNFAKKLNLLYQKVLKLN